MPAVEGAVRMATKKLSCTHLQVFCRAIFGGWLVGQAVVLSTTAQGVGSKASAASAQPAG